MKQPKVLLISEFPPPAGGIGVQALCLFNILKSENIYVRRLVINKSFHVLNKIPVVRTIVSWLVFINHLIIALLFNTHIYILANSFLNYFLFTVPSCLFCIFLRRSYVIHYHGGAAEKFFLKWFWAIRWTFIKAKTVCVPSEFLAKIFGNYGIIVSIVPNFVNLDSFKFRLRDDIKPNILVARHLEIAYDIPTAIRTFALFLKKVPDAKLVICGGGSLRLQIETLIKNLQIDRSITMTGAISHEKMAEYFDQCDIFLNTSITDNQPVAIIEAFASGLPVVSTNAGGIPYLVTHEKTGLLAPIADSQCLARELFRLYQDHELYKKLTKNAFSESLQYQWPNSRKVYHEVFQKLFI
jgi:glycosyltransferase involved in cell wall biosynthesis